MQSGSHGKASAGQVPKYNNHKKDHRKLVTTGMQFNHKLAELTSSHRLSIVGEMLHCFMDQLV